MDAVSGRATLGRCPALRSPPRSQRADPATHHRGEQADPEEQQEICVYVYGRSGMDPHREEEQEPGSEHRQADERAPQLRA